MVECSSLLQCSCRILVSRGTSESDLLGRTWCGRSGSYCLVKELLEHQPKIQNSPLPHIGYDFDGKPPGMAEIPTLGDATPPGSRQGSCFLLPQTCLFHD